MSLRGKAVKEWSNLFPLHSIRRDGVIHLFSDTVMKDLNATVFNQKNKKGRRSRETLVGGFFFAMSYHFSTSCPAKSAAT